MAAHALRGRVVAITGGARGIGRATASALLQAGAMVAIGDLDPDRLAETVGELGHDCVGLPLDVRDPTSWVRFLDDVEHTLGPIDVLVNNAGVMLLSSFTEEHNDRSDLMIDVNLRGVLIGTRLGLRRMIPRNRGHVVNVASSLGKIPLAGAATYCATKHAVIGMSGATRAEIRSTGIEISCVLPALVNTELGGGVGRQAFGTIEPEDVAQAIVRVLKRPRFMVFVPRSAGVATWLLATLPARAGDWLLRTLHGDDVFLKRDAAARSAYEARYVHHHSGAS